MEFELPERYAAIREEARGVAAGIADVAVEADGLSDRIHPDVLAALRSSNLTELMVPKVHGGRFDDVDPLAVCVAREGLMGTSSHLDSLFALQGIGSYAITRGGSAEQQARWLPAVGRAEVLAALALTEPVAGSDLKSMTTTLTETADGLVVNGEKAFISNAGHASFYTVLAKEGEGFSVVLVPADAEGITFGPTPPIIAPHVLGSVTLDHVVVDPANRLGEPGRGFDLVLSTLAVFRVSVAGASIGLAEAALREATRHANERVQFGRPLARLGAVAALLADSWTDLEQARLLTYRSAARARQDPLSALPHSSMAKLAASEAVGRIVDRCVQVMGRWGLVADSVVERAYRTARPMRVYEGASEVLRLGIAKALGDEYLDEVEA
ncbi:Butyryl-CoA dehydrogenase [Euzebya pacifica]|uniref:Butyryl-CoA dehydrogenase n=2 Tax=Euzebya pacifica TaxID=1608957 RepID=A0A346Y315_9ACTN|nr:Butyryl-CoA dehydrogenase [Euzebya pacifica]